MCRRWRLTFGALCGAAAAVTLMTLAAAQVAADETGQNENHRWQTEAAEGEITVTWNGNPTTSPDPVRPAHPHGNDQWEYQHTGLEPQPWTGSPGPSPCDGNPDRSHCAHVVVHQNPWQIGKRGHPEDAKVKLSLCADVSGSDPPPGDLLIRGEQATCTDGDDPYASAKRHGDADFIAQWDDRINAKLTGADRIEANAHTLPDIPRRNDEVVSRGHHPQSRPGRRELTHPARRTRRPVRHSRTSTR